MEARTPDLAAELTRERPRTALPSAKVLPTAVSNANPPKRLHARRDP